MEDARDAVIYEYNPARSRAARLSHHALACSPDLEPTEQRDGSVRSVYLLIGSGVVCEQDAAAGGEAVSPRSFSGGVCRCAGSCCSCNSKQEKRTS